MDLDTNNGQDNSFISNTLKAGLTLGFFYALIIFIENKFFYQNPLAFGAAKTVGYLLFLSGLFYIGTQLKKNFNGHLSFKESLKGLLIVIIAAELIYTLFNILYVKVIEPDFFEKMKISWEAYFRNMNLPGDAIDDALTRFDEGGRLTLLNTIGSYGMSIVIDAIFAILIAAFLRGKKKGAIDDTSLQNFGTKL